MAENAIAFKDNKTKIYRIHNDAITMTTNITNTNMNTVVPVDISVMNSGYKGSLTLLFVVIAILSLNIDKVTYG